MPEHERVTEQTTTSLPPLSALRPDRRRQIQRMAEVWPGEGRRRALAVSDNPLLPGALEREADWEVFRPAARTDAEEDNRRLPAEDGAFDVVLLAMTEDPDPLAWTREIHRVLDEKGAMVFMVRRRKPWTLAGGLSRLTGITPGPQRCYRPDEVFDRLKDGFDLPRIREHTRALQFSHGLVFDLLEGWSGSADPCRAWQGFAGLWARTSYGLAGILDRGLCLTHGYLLSGCAFRRPWSPRRTPVLRDGRSIAEAALGSKIGSAAPF